MNGKKSLMLKNGGITFKVLFSDNPMIFRSRDCAGTGTHVVDVSEIRNIDVTRTADRDYIYETIEFIHDGTEYVSRFLFPDSGEDIHGRS